MRGKVKALQWGYDNSRITPAYAGKRNVPAFAGAFFRDHPCVCGEKFLGLTTEVRNAGSPLRMRGKVRTLQVITSVTGITPAYAGKS